MFGRIDVKDNSVDVKVPIHLMKERDSGRVVIYTPALEVCGYGNTADEAKRDLDNAVKIFLEETTRKGTFEKALKELGWKEVTSPSRKPYWESSMDMIDSAIEELTVTAA